MLLPQLTSATTATLLPASGAVAVAGQAGFLLAYDAASELAGLEQAGSSEPSNIVAELAGAIVADAPLPTGAVMVDAEKVHVAAADPVIAAVGPGPQSTQAGLPADDLRPPLKSALHFVAQMMVDRPAMAAMPDEMSGGMSDGMPVADRAARPVPAVAVPGPQQALPDVAVAPADVPDAATSMLQRATVTSKDPAPAARPFTGIGMAPSLCAVANAPPVAQPAPQTEMALPVPMPPAVNEPLQPTTNTALVKRATHVIESVKWLDPKVGAPAGDGPSDTPFSLSADTASVGGTARVADGQSAPGLARHVAQQLAVTVTQTAGQPTEIALNPEELGRVRMSMSVTDGTLVLQINAERPETTELLRRHIDTLAQEFRNMGYSDVSFDFGERRAEKRNDGKADPLNDHVEEATDSHETNQGVTRNAHGALDLRL